jgi:hypothetical protein
MDYFLKYFTVSNSWQALIKIKNITRFLALPSSGAASVLCGIFVNQL